MNTIQQTKEKWQGKAKTELVGCKADQVWPLLEDFFGLDKWFSTLSHCIPVEGTSGKPGCVRFYAGFKTPIDKYGKQNLNWTKRKLLSIDPNPIQRMFRFAIVDGNVGFQSYVSTVRVLPKDNGCEIEWIYEVEHVEGWRLKYLDLLIGSGLDELGQRMQGALKTMEDAIKI